MNFSKKKIALAVGLASFAVTGCTVIPQELTTAETLDAGLKAKSALINGVEPVKGEISLEQAIARALKYNRERRVALMESTLSQIDLDNASFDMLPSLSANAGYTKRDEWDVSSSGTFDPAVGELEPVSPPAYSGSSPKENTTHELAMTWDVLDFGLSYVRAGQKADSVLIARERERKAIHNLITDVRNAYWRAASAQRLLKRVKPLVKRVGAALEDARKSDVQRLQSPIDALDYQKELLDMQRTLQALQRDLNDAETSLATLMGMQPNKSFKLKDVEDTDYEVLDIILDIETLEKTALALRPEMLESHYGERISLTEGKAALLSLLPGLRLNATAHYDDNDYLYNDRWNDYGAQLSFNLFNVFKIPSVNDRSEKAKQLARERMLAMTASVIGQVHLSTIIYQHSRKEFTTASEYLDVVTQIGKHQQRLFESGAAGELPLIRSELTTVLSELRRDVAYANLQNSYGRVYASAGLDPYTINIENESVDALASAVTEQLENWKIGKVGIVVRPINDQIKPWQGAGEHAFELAPDTFLLGGNITFNATQLDGTELPAWMKFDPTSGRFNGNPPATIAELEIRVVAQNESGVQASDTFKLALNRTNDKPECVSNLTIDVTENSVVTGKLECKDADGDELTISLARWQKLPKGMTLDSDGKWTFDTTNDLYQRLAEGEVLSRDVRVVVSDAFGGKTRATIKVTVEGRGSNQTLAPE